MMSACEPAALFFTGGRGHVQEETARAMPGVGAEKSARAGCVVVALRGELDVCTAADGVSALTALAAGEVRIVVDLTELAFMDCYSLG
jgi:anti-anti-sigma regulatory factor